MNRVILLGRLAQDPEIRYTQSGKAVASFTVAVNRFSGDEADFIPVVAWEKLAESCGNNLVKGQRVLVEGKLQIRSYEKDGQKRRVAEVIAQAVEFLDKPNAKSEAKEESPFGGQVFPEDDVPF